MKRKVYLTGEIEKLFGSEFSMYADSYGEIIRNIECNRPGFKQYLLKSHDMGVDFTVNFAGKNIEEKELFTPIKEGDVTIAAVPAGSKSEVGQVILGIILIYVGVVFGQPGAALEGWGMFITGIGMSLASAGIQQMLAPDPATDEKEEEGYLYSGSESIIVEGDPIPLLYGKLRVPGQPISIGMTTTGGAGNYSNVYTSSAGFGSIEIVIDLNLPNSDIRLKENITQIGRANDFNIYSWDWNEKGMELCGGQPTIGVIAQEVVKTRPDAAWLENGYYVVDYSKLGVFN